MQQMFHLLCTLSNDGSCAYVWCATPLHRQASRVKVLGILVASLSRGFASEEAYATRMVTGVLPV